MPAQGCLLWGVPAQEGACWGGVSAQGGDPPKQMATVADGMHPTGMHSCCTIFSSLLDLP